MNACGSGLLHCVSGFLIVVVGDWGPAYFRSCLAGGSATALSLSSKFAWICSQLPSAGPTVGCGTAGLFSTDLLLIWQADFGPLHWSFIAFSCIEGTC